VSNGVEKLIQMCGKGKAKVLAKAKPGTGQVDFLLQVKDQVLKLEVKYQFPKVGTDSLNRLVTQVNKQGGEVASRLALFFGKEIGPKAFGNREHILASLVKAGAEPTLMVNGFFQLAGWLAEAAGEACH
jgi:hypothetical protein